MVMLQCCFLAAAHRHVVLFLSAGPPLTGGTRPRPRIGIEMRDRSKNRKPTQRGRYLSSEAIAAVQSLKRSKSKSKSKSNWANREREKETLQRLIKSDMVAVMRELLSQGEPLLALLVFEEIRQEHWYRPQLSMYLDIISLLARFNLKTELEHTFSCLKREYYLDADTERFNLLIQLLLQFGYVHLALDAYRLMKLWDCDPDRDTFTILITELESIGQMDVSHSLRLEAQKKYGTVHP